MAGRAGLTARAGALLVLGVLAAHLLVVGQVHQALEQPSVLQAMPMVMYTRMLAPAAPPPPPPPPTATVRAARKPVERPRPAVLPASASPAASASASAPAPEAQPQIAPQPPPKVAEASVPAAASASSPASAAESSPATAPPKPDLSTWPADTRLTYRLGGEFRGGPLFGDAQVQWQRNDTKYQVRAEVSVTPWAHLVMTSQGEVTAEGLAPGVYEEESRGRKRRRALVESGQVRLDNGNTVARPPAVQDTASQFVELGHRFASGAITLRSGEPVTVWLARPGGVDLWTYDVSGPVPLATPKLGSIEAYHLKPRPLPNARGNLYAEMWFAPSLQHLPVRIKLLMGEADYLDLVIEAIEQR